MPLLLLFLVLKSQILAVRESVDEKYEEGFESDRIQTFRFTQREIRENLRWEHDREFEYKGQMYDVIERKTIDGLIMLTVYADHEETELKLKMAHLLHENPDEAEDEKIRSDFHFQLFQSASESWSPNPFFYQSKPLNSIPLKTQLSRNSSPPTPPPDSVK